MRILVINTYRLGDVVQTLPLLRACRQTYPEATIDLVATLPYAAICSGNRDVDRILVAAPEEPAHAAALGLTVFRSEALLAQHVGTGHYELCVNLSVEPFSMQLATRVSAATKIGAVYNEQGRIVRHGKLSVYAASCVLFRRLSRLNLVDAFLLNAGLPVPDETELWSEASDDLTLSHILEERHVEQSSLFACIQPGSKDAFRRFPPAAFARVADGLIDAGYGVAILGSSSERGLAEEIQANMIGRAVAMIGLDLLELRAFLRGAALLVTNDTGPMHIAAALGTPVLTLCFGPSSPVETAGYRSGVVSMMADLPCAPCNKPEECTIGFECRDVIRPEDVLSVIARELPHGAYEDEQRHALRRRFLFSTGRTLSFRAVRDEPHRILRQAHAHRSSAAEFVRELLSEAWFSTFCDQGLPRGYIGSTVRARNAAFLSLGDAKLVEFLRATATCTKNPSVLNPWIDMDEIARVLPLLIRMAPEEGREQGYFLRRFLETLSEEASDALRA